MSKTHAFLRSGLFPFRFNVVLEQVVFKSVVALQMRGLARTEGDGSPRGHVGDGLVASGSDLGNDLAALDLCADDASTFCHSASLLQPLHLEGAEIAIHGVAGELLAGDERVLLQGALDQGVAAGLVEEGDAVALAVVVVRLAGGLDAVEGRLEAVIGPRHQQVADVADDGVRGRVRRDFRPGVAVAEGRGDFAARADL